MNLMRKIILLSLAAALCLSAVSCAKEEVATTTLNETLTDTAETAKISDQEAIQSFLTAYRAGEYEKGDLFAYDDYFQFVELGEYKGLTYPEDEMLNETVTDEEVNDYLTGIQVVGVIPDEDFEKLTEGVVQKFDTVIIDFHGVVDGVESENTAGKDQELLIGSNSYITGFETGLIGAEVGKEVRLDLKFSPYYGSADVAGKDVTFYVTVKEISRPKSIPELKVEDINKLYGSTFATMEDVWNDIQGFLQEEKESQAYSALAGYLQNKALKACTFKELPQHEVDYFKQYYIDYNTQEKQEDQSIEEYCEEVLKTTYEKLQENALSYAEECVKGELLVRALAQKEEIAATDEELEETIIYFYQTEGYYYGDVNSFLTAYAQAYGADVFEREVTGTAAIEVLVDNAIKAE